MSAPDNQQQQPQQQPLPTITHTPPDANHAPFTQQPQFQQQPFHLAPTALPRHTQYVATNTEAGQTLAPQVVQSKRSIFFKLGMHATAVAIQIIILGITFSFINKSDSSTYFLLITIPIPIVSLVWSAAELIVRAVRKYKTGIHPAAHVALCLIIWLAASISGGSLVTYAVICDSSDYCSDFEDNGTSDSHSRFFAAGIFTWISCIIYFILFVFACIDTARHNANKKVPIMIVNPGYWAQGWQPMPQQTYAQQTYAQQQPQQHTAHAHGEDIPMVNTNPSAPTNQAPPVASGYGSGAQNNGAGVMEYWAPTRAN